MSLCKSCSAEIRWAFTANGERIPVDRHPVAGGNLRLIQGEGLRIDARVVGSTIDMLDPTDDGTRWMPHHATCPDAEQWRQR